MLQVNHIADSVSTYLSIRTLDQACRPGAARAALKLARHETEQSCLAGRSFPVGKDRLVLRWFNRGSPSQSGNSVQRVSALKAPLQRLFGENEQPVERGQIVIRDEPEPVGRGEFLQSVYIPQS